jgi:hypothetical protein
LKIVVVITLTCTLFLSLSIQAQTKEEQAYRKASEKMRSSVWGWSDPKFKVREVPAVFASASKVVIAHHVELNAEGSCRTSFFILSSSKQNISEVVREVVKLNDKIAIEEYSEISFTRFMNSSGFSKEEITNTMIGVRVIKPDGTVREINADDIVLTRNDKTAKRAKLAVPDLQPGDIIDYYIATVADMTNNFSASEYILRLFDDAPVINYSFHAEVGKKYWVKYRSYNGAPKVKTGSNEEKYNVIDVSSKDMPAFETTLWVSPARQLPFIRIRMGVGHSSTKKIGEVSEYTGNDIAITELRNGIYNDERYYKSTPGDIVHYKWMVKQARTAAKRTDEDYKNMSINEQAAQIYYTKRFYSYVLFNGDETFSQINLPKKEFRSADDALYLLFNVADLEPSIIGAEDRTGFRYSEAITDDDLVSTAYISQIDKFFELKSIFDLSFQIPEEIEGAKDTRVFDFSKKSGEAAGPKVPTSKSTDNARLEKYNLTLVPGNNTFQAKRYSTLKGHYKEDVQRALVLYEDYYEEERIAMGIKETLLVDLADSKGGKKMAAELKNAFNEARKKQIDAFEQDAKEWTGLDITSLTGNKIHNMGL